MLRSPPPSVVSPPLATDASFGRAIVTVGGGDTQLVLVLRVLVLVLVLLGETCRTRSAGSDDGSDDGSDGGCWWTRSRSEATFW